MREVAVIAYAQTPMTRDAGAQNEVELIMQVVHQALDEVKLNQTDIDFTCSGSCDYLQGVTFAFVDGLNAVSSVPPINESHVEMDAAWALYESWLKIQMEEADVALVYGFGKSSPGELRSIMTLQLDPYYLAPLWPDSVSLAALQAKAMIDSKMITEESMAKVVKRSRKNAKSNPNSQLSGDFSIGDLLSEPIFVSPLRKHDCSPITDGASAIILATKEKALSLCRNPAFITSIDHRIETAQFGYRNLTSSPSIQKSSEVINLSDYSIDAAELHAPFSHQELLLIKELQLNEEVSINKSGGVLAGNIMMSAGLDRIGSMFNLIKSGKVRTGLAHATSGPCLQQNMLIIMESKNE